MLDWSANHTYSKLHQPSHSYPLIETASIRSNWVAISKVNKPSANIQFSIFSVVEN